MPSIPPVIDTPRLRLREPRLADKDRHVAMWADPRTTRFIGGEPRTPDVSWNKFLGAAGLRPVMGYGYWVVADRADDRQIGRAHVFTPVTNAHPVSRILLEKKKH